MSSGNNLMVDGVLLTHSDEPCTAAYNRAWLRVTLALRGWDKEIDALAEKIVAESIKEVMLDEKS